MNKTAKCLKFTTIESVNVTLYDSLSCKKAKNCSKIDIVRSLNNYTNYLDSPFTLPSTYIC